jgi:hypothetical protein
MYIFNPTVFPMGEVKVDLDHFDVKMQKNLLYREQQALGMYFTDIWSHSAATGQIGVRHHLDFCLKTLQIKNSSKLKYC